MWSCRRSPVAGTSASLRVNDPATGHPRWSADLPFAVTVTLADGPRFYAFGSHNAGHFIAEIDARTGRVRRIVSGVPMLVDDLYRAGDLLIATAIREGVVAIRLPH